MCLMHTTQKEDTQKAQILYDIKIIYNPTTQITFLRILIYLYS